MKSSTRFVSSGIVAGLFSLIVCQVESKAAQAVNEKSSQATSKTGSPIGLKGVELDEIESDFSPNPTRFIIPPYYNEVAGPVRIHIVFPMFFYRERVGAGSRVDLGVLPFYWRYREGASRLDAVFPLYWRIRNPSFDTDIVLQTYFSRGDWGYKFGFGPLLFLGENYRDDSSHQMVPPLFWRVRRGAFSFLLAGPYYDRTDGADYDLGLPPLFFAGRERYKSYLLVLPPIFWWFGDEIAYKTTTVLPPLFFTTRENGYSFGLVPLLYLARDRDWDRTLITPFYYGSRWQHTNNSGELLGEGRSYYFPFLLSYYRHAPGLSQGGSMVFYHWYWNEGDYLKVITPMLWLWGNDRSDDRSILVPPLFYRRTSPVRDDTMVGLVYWNFADHYRERTFSLAPLFVHNWSLYENRWRTWVAPTFDFGVKPQGYHFRIHPIFYLGRAETSYHLVLAPIIWKFRDEEDDDLVVFPMLWLFKDLLHDHSANVIFPFFWDFNKPRKEKFSNVLFPLYWDFKNGRKGERTTLILPLFWRDRDSRSAMTGVLNFIWHKGEIKGNSFWNFNFFPFLAFGQPPAPSGAYWNLLSGLVGWRRQGSTKELKLFWIPFDLGD